MLPFQTMSRARNFARTFAGTIAGLLVLAVVLLGTFEVVTRFKTGQIAHDDSLFMLASYIGGIVGLLVGGYVAARTVRWLHGTLSKLLLLLIGPGLWVMLAQLVVWIASKDAATEELSKLLLPGLVIMLTSMVGAFAGARERSS